MTVDFSRRSFLTLLSAAAILPSPARLSAAPVHHFRIRTITAGAKLANAGDMNTLHKAADFLQQSRLQFEAMEYEVQTLRIATQALAAYLPDWQRSASLDALKELDAFAEQHNVMFNIGPVNNEGQNSDEFVSWLTQLLADTGRLSCSLVVASAGTGIDHQSIALAAEIMAAISTSSTGGEGNFRFAATAYCPPATPFFPAAYFNDDAFSIGLESADLLQQTFAGADNMSDAVGQLKINMEAALEPIERQAEKIAITAARAYSGIDTSPAPNLDVSIARAIETLSGVPFGSMSTLAACAAITNVLKSLQIKSCGYSGLMLPVLEDTVLAERAREGRYGVADLLLFSSVCGTGLDVVPLPGDISVRQLSALVGDVAALSNKYHKPLSARLFPVPGKKAGELVKFDNPYLTDAVVMGID